VNTASFFGPESKRFFHIFQRDEEVSSIVSTPPENSVSLHERIAVVETTAMVGKLALGGLVAILIGFFSFFYTNVIPDKVEQGISNSTTLNGKFTEVREDVKKLDGRFEQLISTIRPLVSPKILAAALKDSAAAEQASLPSALSEIKNLLAVARDMKVLLRGRDYNEISQQLFRQYAAAPALRKEIWLTIIDVANTRTRTDAILHRVSDPELAKAKGTQNYFEGNIDLSSRTTWERTIFKNGKIKISKPYQDLTLTRVRFIDDEFELVAEDQTSRNLLESVLKSDGPEVTAPVVRFKVITDAKVTKVARLRVLSPGRTLVTTNDRSLHTLARKYSH
jgi:hypothetical protein